MVRHDGIARETNHCLVGQDDNGRRAAAGRWMSDQLLDARLLEVGGRRVGDQHLSSTLANVRALTDEAQAERLKRLADLATGVPTKDANKLPARSGHHSRACGTRD